MPNNGKSFRQCCGLFLTNEDFWLVHTRRLIRSNPAPPGTVSVLSSSAYLGSVLAPAGDVHCSAKDLANYGRAHLDGLNGRDGVVSART